MLPKKRSICPVACALDLIGDKWILLLIRDLGCGKKYFGDFIKSPERIATNILTDRLEKLVEYGLVEKYVCEEESNREAYRLTNKGNSLEPILIAVRNWGLKNIDGTEARMKPKFGLTR